MLSLGLIRSSGTVRKVHDSFKLRAKDKKKDAKGAKVKERKEIDMTGCPMDNRVEKLTWFWNKFVVAREEGATPVDVTLPWQGDENAPDWVEQLIDYDTPMDPMSQLDPKLYSFRYRSKHARRRSLRFTNSKFKDKRFKELIPRYVGGGKQRPP